MKKWYESKTIWLGIVAVLVAALEAYQANQKWPAILLAVFGAMTVLIRTTTKDEITK